MVEFSALLTGTELRCNIERWQHFYVVTEHRRDWAILERENIGCKVDGVVDFAPPVPAALQQPREGG